MTLSDQYQVQFSLSLKDDEGIYFQRSREGRKGMTFKCLAFILRLAASLPPSMSSMFFFHLNSLLWWSYSCGWKSCSFPGSQGKHSRDTSTRRCGMVRLIWVKIEGCLPGAPLGFQCSISIHPAMKKSNFVCIKARNGANVQIICVILKLSPLEPSAVCCGSQAAARSAWLL